MSFLKKKRFKFQTDVIVADLSDVPFVNAVLFAKVRLLDGGRYAQSSPRSYLLEGYGASQHGQDNSRLRINVSMVLLTADTCFKVPVHPSISQHGQLNPANRKGPSPCQPTNNGSSSSGNDQDGQSVNSGSSGFESLPRSVAKQNKHPAITVDETLACMSVDMFERSHSRSASQTSQPSVTSGYASGGPNNINIPNNNHSRQSSSEGQFGGVGPLSATVLGHSRRPSSGPLPGIETSRVNPEDFVNELLSSEFGSAMEVDEDKSGETSGLQLYICKEDGTTSLGSRASTLKPGTYEKVVIPRLSDDESR